MDKLPDRSARQGLSIVTASIVRQCDDDPVLGPSGVLLSCHGVVPSFPKCLLYPNTRSVHSYRLNGSAPKCCGNYPTCHLGEEEEGQKRAGCKDKTTMPGCKAVLRTRPFTYAVESTDIPPPTPGLLCRYHSSAPARVPGSAQGLFPTCFSWNDRRGTLVFHPPATRSSGSPSEDHALTHPP